jgi:hypothetical protein
MSVTPQGLEPFIKTIVFYVPDLSNTRNEFLKKQKAHRGKRKTMKARRLNVGNVMLNFYFVIQDVLFIFILVHESFHP